MPMRACIRLFPWLLLSLSACSSIEWRPRPTDELWQGRSLWCAEQVTVAAVEEGSAEEAVAVWERVRTAFAIVGEAPPPAPLIVCVGVPEPPLLGDGEKTLECLAKAHRKILAAEGSGGGSGFRMQGDASPELVAAMAKAVASAMPLDTPELALPGSWQQTSAWGMVMPDEAAIATVTDLMIDEGMRKADIGFAKRLLMAPFMPWVRSMMRDKLQEMVLRQFVDASCSPRVLGRTCAPTVKIAVLEALGLPPTMQPPEPPPDLPVETKPR